MDSLPDAILVSIFTCLYSAREVANCNCVSKRWKDTLPHLRSLYFTRSSFDKVEGDHPATPDIIILRMIAALDRLDKLIVYSKFTATGLASWLIVAGSSLKQLELRMDYINGDPVCEDSSPSKMDCLAYAKNLESMKLWGVHMTKPPKWDGFRKLQNLEIVGAMLEDSALTSALKGCPNLKTLALLGCEGIGRITIDLRHLVGCRLAFRGMGNCMFTLTSPKVEVLEVQGCSWIGVPHTKCLKNLTISSDAGRVYVLDFGDLTALESLTIRGVQWCWDAVSKIINSAREVKQLFMRVEFAGDLGSFDPFPDVDFVEFFNSHPKLRKFEIHGAMFAALCHKNSHINLEESGFVIPALEEVVIKVRSPLKAEQKINILESLIKYGKNIKAMAIRILEIKSAHGSTDDFFADICRFQQLNRNIVRLE
ncbi:F-box protein At1g10780 [Linum grandiflorum]